MASLIRFIVMSCPLLSSLPKGMRGMGALEELELRAMSHKLHWAIKVNVHEWSKVRHIPSVKLFPDGEPVGWNSIIFG